LFEFAVAAALLGVFVTILLSRMVAYQAEAERVAAAQLIATIRTALQVRAAQAVGAGGESGLRALKEQNPLDWLSEKPKNYLGEFYTPSLGELPQGNWLFDRTDKSLVYLLRQSQNFSIRTSNFLKFKVKLASLPTPTAANGRSKITKGLVFDQVIDRSAVNN
jgi:hypothetical protein